MEKLKIRATINKINMKTWEGLETSVLIEIG